MAKLSDWTAIHAETPPPPDPDVIDADFTEQEDPAPLTDLIMKLGESAAHNFTSDDMETDFSVAVELLQESRIYMKILNELIARFGVLSESRVAELKNHIERVDDFAGMWD